MSRIEDALRHEDSQDPMGTRASKYSPAADGPFECEHCRHYDGKGNCNHPVLMADQEMEHNEHGDAMVEAGGCCEFFRKTAKHKAFEQEK